MDTPTEPPLVNVHEAKTHFSRLLERAHAGEEIILAKAGRAYARMLPLPADDKPRRRPGQLKGWIIPGGFFDPLPEDELPRWEERSATESVDRRG